uniref:HGWP repeat containing protein-like n=1 Tax=Oryza sativa subsp. japonica TaxID=39947 RepID=Q5Z5L0_ORYSJ|nr:HGWP repeat containing protein-like [Oryza sativa Japonica Group]BAD62044.1 HGWP repeat containing protein-like [Oryza sativa Japonica Group]
MVAGGDHRGAGAPLPSAVPARPPSGAPSRLPDAAASEDPLFVEVEAGVWESEQGKSHHP